MAHFAKISEENEVLQVLSMEDVHTADSEGVETESIGQQYLETHNNWPAHLWIQTSYNTYRNQHILGGTPFRGNYASVGYEWDQANNIFWPQKPYASWVKNTTTASWESPIGAAPELTEEEATANKRYYWNEANQSWDLTDPVA
tara:strand:- start:1182 stop:1613 length:432 start_codon:yes stop_codon:yes gene_type:complete